MPRYSTFSSSSDYLNKLSDFRLNVELCMCNNGQNADSTEAEGEGTVHKILLLIHAIKKISM